MVVDKFLVVVIGRFCKHTFQCDVHCTETPTTRLIEPEFYDKCCNGKVPQGIHHEMEIMEPTAVADGLPVHIHINPHTKRRFLCWTGSLPTSEKARELFVNWCIGTAYTLETKKDFAPFLHEYSKDFIPKMAQVHGIKLNMDMTTKAK